jgi:hypothetical protein
MYVMINGIRIDKISKIDIYGDKDGEDIDSIDIQFHGGTLYINANSQKGYSILLRGDAQPFLVLNTDHCIKPHLNGIFDVG